jgi:hypothetical protein
MRAMLGQDVAFGGRVRMQRTMHPGMRLPPGLLGDLAAALLPLRRGRAQLVRRLRGRSSFSRSLAFSARNTAISASRADSRNSGVAISTSFSALDNDAESGGSVTHRLTHANSPGARKLYNLPDLAWRPAKVSSASDRR